MITTEERVTRHYGGPNPAARLFSGLENAGFDIDRVGVEDLAPADEIHVRGREATTELAELIELGPDREVIDVGSGIGGSARYLATRYGCSVTGVDLTPEYCDLARELSARVNLSDRTRFFCGSALELPFVEGSFDVAWTEHAQMNIADKRRFYSEIGRVLRPDGAFVFHDIFAGNGPALRYPVPWAADVEASFLYPADELRALLEGVGFEVEVWRDTSELSIEWARALTARLRDSGPPPLGVHLMLGDRVGEKIGNIARGFESGSLRTIQAVLRLS